MIDEFTTKEEFDALRENAQNPYERVYEALDRSIQADLNTLKEISSGLSQIISEIEKIKGANNA